MQNGIHVKLLKAIPSVGPFGRILIITKGFHLFENISFIIVPGGFFFKFNLLIHRRNQMKSLCQAVFNYNEIFLD